MADANITIVIMNWARPRNVWQLIDKYAGYSRVGEIIIWDASHSKPMPSCITTLSGSKHLGERKEPAGEKIKYVRSQVDFGLYPRFAMAAIAQYPAVLLVDDDIDLPSATVNALYEKWMCEQKIIHGLFGRNPDADGLYPSSYASGACQVILTRAAMMSRALAAAVLPYGAQHLITLPGEPRGNGEDIVASHVAMATSGKLNRAHTLPYTNMNYRDEHAISVRFAGHAAHRTSMVVWCRHKILKGVLPTS
jgi:hypothetical protein